MRVADVEFDATCFYVYYSILNKVEYFNRLQWGVPEEICCIDHNTPRDRSNII